MSWRRFLRRGHWDRERNAELESYIQIETDDNIARGMTDGAAREAAKRKLGNSTRIREEIYGINSIAFLDSLNRDLRHGFRALRRNPIFAIVALLTLAIGIGANTAVFSVLNSVLLKPLSYPDAEQLVAVWNKAPGAPGLASVAGDLRLSASMFFTYADHNRTFQHIGLWASGEMTVTGISQPEQVRAVFVSDGTLQALGVQPALGRWLSQADQVPAGPANVMISYGYWQRRFGGDKAVVGRGITVDSSSREIVGIMPQGFRIANADFDLVAPLAFDRSKLILAGFGFQGIARLKPGVTIAEADTDMARMLPIWMNGWPTITGGNPLAYESWKIAPSLRPLKQEVVGNIGNVLWVLMGTIGIVLLIACANVANLLLVRAESRQQELALRAALGAGWGRIVRELLIESVMLGLVGGTLGLALVYAGLRFLVALGPPSLPRLAEIAIDPLALVFTLIVSLASGLLFGIIPALKYAGPRVSLTLRAGGRALTQGRERHRTRNILVVAQVALALVLLVSSGLMIRTFQALRTVEPGFAEPQQVQTLRVSIPPSLVPGERAARMLNDILDKLASIPGVASVGFSNAIPMDGTTPDWDAVDAEGQTIPDRSTSPMRTFKFVSPGLFQATGTKLLAGRDYTWLDLYGGRPVAIVSQNLARELWGTTAAAVGKRIRTIPSSAWREVIGVVQDVHENGVQEPAPAIVYWPAIRESLYAAGQDVTRSVTFAIRSKQAGTEGLLNQIRNAVWSVNPELSLASVRTLQDVYDQSLQRMSFTLVMLAIAGAAALALGVIGIYGVISYAVSQRTREMGIRLALGAPQSDLKRMIVRHGLSLTGTGVVIGLAVASLATRLMSSLLFEVSPRDPATYIAAPVILLLAAFLASYLPARRAASVDPVEALKME